VLGQAHIPEPEKSNMKTTTFLGDKPINRMGYGAMQLAGPGVFGPPRDPSAARAVLRRAIELGVDDIDTSQYYGRTWSTT
jgi:aryl-alcohol dehydrogenase-like predicted oxidoreductase